MCTAKKWKIQNSWLRRLPQFCFCLWLADGLAMGVRRAHDISKTGWICLLLLIPLVNLLPLYWLYFKLGDKGAMGSG